MNRAVKLNYLFIGVLGGMVAMWACGDDTMKALTGGGGSSGTAHAQEQPSSCKKWEVKVHDTGYFDAPALASGEEPFAVATGDVAYVYTKKCVDD